ncbi:hypothetical protein SAMN05216436_11422 [bacterium A37T11]|nr:hypothetical protein SAMN05216436_11422 [bacterium A37T11]
MQKELGSTWGGKSEQSIPVLGIDGYPVRRIRWLTFWYWSGWQYLIAIGQVLGLSGVYLICGPLIRWFDPTAGVLDTGILSVCVLSILVMDAMVVSAWLLLRLVQGELTKGISSCLKAKIISGTFWGLVLLSFFGFWVLLS